MVESTDTQNLPPLAQIKQLISPGARYWNRHLPEDDSLHGYAAALQNSHEFILYSLEEYSTLQPSPVTAEWAQGALGASFCAYRWGAQSLPSLCHPSLTTRCELASGIHPTFTAKESVKKQEILCAATHSRYTYTADTHTQQILISLWSNMDFLYFAMNAIGIKSFPLVQHQVCPGNVHYTGKEVAVNAQEGVSLWVNKHMVCLHRSAGIPQGFQIHWSQ